MRKFKIFNITMLLIAFIFPMFMTGCDFLDNIFNNMKQTTVFIDQSCVDVLSVSNTKATKGETVYITIDETYIVDAIYVNEEEIFLNYFSMPAGTVTITADVHELRTSGSYVCIGYSSEGDTVRPFKNYGYIDFEGDLDGEHLTYDEEVFFTFRVENKNSATISFVGDVAEVLGVSSFNNYHYECENDVISMDLGISFEYEFNRINKNNITLTYTYNEDSVILYYTFIKDIDLTDDSYEVYSYSPYEEGGIALNSEDPWVIKFVDDDSVIITHNDVSVNAGYSVSGDVVKIYNIMPSCEFEFKVPTEYTEFYYSFSMCNCTDLSNLSHPLDYLMFEKI